MALSEITRVLQMGICCRICDRKFFLRATYQQHHNQSSFYAAEAQDFKQNFNELKADFEEIKKELKEVDLQTKNEDERYIKEDVKKRLELERL